MSGDPDVNGLIVMCAPQGNARPDEMALRVIELAKAQRKPVIAVLMGGENVATARDMFKSADVPCHDTPEDAVRAYMNMYEYTRNLELLLRDTCRATHRRRATQAEPQGDAAQGRAHRNRDADRGGVEEVHLHLRVPRRRAKDRGQCR